MLVVLLLLGLFVLLATLDQSTISIGYGTVVQLVILQLVSLATSTGHPTTYVVLLLNMPLLSFIFI